MIFIYCIVNFSSSAQDIPRELLLPNKIKVDTKGLPAKDNHDPSNIIFYKGNYYLWYTNHIITKDQPFDPFVNTRIDYVTSVDGINWEYQGIAIEKGKKGSLDENGVLTAYVVPWATKFYLFYTVVSGDFEHYSTSKRGISVAIADSPYGPWQKTNKKILWPENDGSWDDIAVDDANIILKNGRWWFYYKGQKKGANRKESQLDLAISDSLFGPYKKQEANPLISAHAFSVWKYEDGIAFVGGQNTVQHVFWSKDGLNFEQAGQFESKSTGFYCPDNFKNVSQSNGVSWGVDVSKTKIRKLSRFDCDLQNE